MPERMSSLFSMIALTRVDRDRVAQRHRVEPADAAGPPGRRADLVAARGDPGADLLVSSVGNGPEPTRVEYAFMTPRTSSTWSGPIAAARARAARDRVRRGHERVRAVVQVEERPLGALEEHVIAPPRGPPGRATSCPRCAAGAARPTRPPGRRARRSSKADAPFDAEQQVLVRAAPRASFSRSDVAVEQVLHPQPDAPGPVGVRRTDPPPRRARPCPRPAGPPAPDRAPRGTA